MKNYIYILLCLSIYSCGQPQKESQVAEPTIDSTTKDSVSDNGHPTSVAEVKQRYSIVNDRMLQGTLDSTSIKYDCSGERTGTVTYFSEQGKIAVITHKYSEYSHFSAEVQYFLVDDSLYFVYSKKVVWSFESGAGEGATKDDIQEERTYLVNNKPVLCLEKKYTKRSKASDNPNPSSLPNSEVSCKDVAPVLADLGKLLAFKQSAKHDCLAK